MEEVVSKDKNNMYATFNLGRTCFALGDTIRAEKFFTTVALEMKEYAKVYFELGKVAAARNKNSDSSLFLGKYYLYEGKLKLARQSLKIALADTGISSKGKEEGEQLLEVIERLEKN